MPVFVLKGKDLVALDGILGYLQGCDARGLDDQVAEVTKAISEFAHWQHRNNNQVKLPDHKHVPAS
jgi:hypothetical protein